MPLFFMRLLWILYPVVHGQSCGGVYPGTVCSVVTEMCSLDRGQLDSFGIFRKSFGSPAANTSWVVGDPPEDYCNLGVCEFCMSDQGQQDFGCLCVLFYSSNSLDHSSIFD